MNLDVGVCGGTNLASCYIRLMVGKPEVKRPLGRPRRRCEDNIKMDLTEVGCEGMDWIVLVQYRDRWRAVVNVVVKLRFYKCGEFLD